MNEKFLKMAAASLEKVARLVSSSDSYEEVIDGIEEEASIPLVKNASEDQTMRKLASEYASYSFMSGVCDAYGAYGLRDESDVFRYAIQKVAHDIGIEDLSDGSFLSMFLQDNPESEEQEKVAEFSGVDPSVSEAIKVLEDAGLLNN